MGANDAAEMLEAARAECVRLERELLESNAHLTKAREFIAFLQGYIPSIWDESREHAFEDVHGGTGHDERANPYRSLEGGNQ